MCLDRVDVFGNPFDFSLYGDWHLDVSRDLTIMYRPCIPMLQNRCMVNDVSNKT